MTRSVAHRPPGPTALAPPWEDVTVHRPFALSVSIQGPEYLNLYPFLSAPGLRTLAMPSPSQLPTLTHRTWHQKAEFSSLTTCWL